MNYILIFLSVFSMAMAQVLLKKGLMVIGESPQSFFELFRFISKAYSNIYVIGAVILTGITMLSWLQVASRLEISYIYPFMAISYVLVALFSMLLFHESVTTLRWIGIGVICIGVFLVSRS